jgi:hypothetical protein
MNSTDLNSLLQPDLPRSRAHFPASRISTQQRANASLSAWASACSILFLDGRRSDETCGSVRRHDGSAHDFGLDA